MSISPPEPADQPRIGEGQTGVLRNCLTDTGNDVFEIAVDLGVGKIGKNSTPDGHFRGEKPVHPTHGKRIKPRSRPERTGLGNDALIFPRIEKAAST
jgi:hypothetical protein